MVYKAVRTPHITKVIISEQTCIVNIRRRGGLCQTAYLCYAERGLVTLRWCIFVVRFGKRLHDVSSKVSTFIVSWFTLRIAICILITILLFFLCFFFGKIAYYYKISTHLYQSNPKNMMRYLKFVSEYILYMFINIDTYLYTFISYLYKFMYIYIIFIQVYIYLYHIYRCLYLSTNQYFFSNQSGEIRDMNQSFVSLKLLLDKTQYNSQHYYMLL